MRPIGIHLRLYSTLSALIRKALMLEVNFFQCFLFLQEANQLINPDDADVAEFLKHRSYFSDLFIHGSYWINLAGIERNGYRALLREMVLAKRLGFTHIIIHPGSAKGAQDRMEGVDALARALNRVTKKEHEITIVLENTAHGNLSVGSDITDFKAVLEKLDRPERIAFCIDTSHAVAYGYDVISPAGQDAFVDLLADTITLEKIALIHLNDTKEKRGSRIDRHAVPGEGIIGEPALKRFIMHPQLCDIPVLLELPLLSDDKEAAVIERMRAWHK